MLLVKVLLVTCYVTWVASTISGLNYMEPFNFKPLNLPIPGEDPCNPLYWYPRNIPDFCFNKNIKPGLKPKPIPVPIPVPVPPQRFPFPMPPIQPQYPSFYPMTPQFPAPPPMPIPVPPLPIPVFPPPMPLPYGIPLEPTNPMLPVAGVPGVPYYNPYQPYRARPQAGMVPGLPGLVMEDGGLNILPFSDAYADVLEKHKQKMIRKKLQKVFDDYDDYPRKQRYRKYRRGILH